MAAPESAAPAAPPAGDPSSSLPPVPPGSPPPSPPPGEQAAEPGPLGLFAQLQSVMRELPGLFSDRVDLFVLELERASQALAQVVVLVVFTAILAATAWLAFWGGVVSVLVDLDWSLPLALLTVLGINLVAAVWAVLRLRQLLPRLSLPATRRHLSFGKNRENPSDTSPTPESAADHANSS